MKEATLVRNIMKAIKAFPRAFAVKLADRHTRGLPDILVLLPGITLFVETKAPTGRLTPIQEATHLEIIRAGGYVLVARSVQEVLDAIKRML